MNVLTAPLRPFFAWTTALWTLVAEALPAEFCARTTTRKVKPTSALVSVRTGPVVEVAAQAPPLRSQRCHA